MEKVLRNATKWVLTAMAFTPLVIYRETTFPFVLPKGVWMRIVIELALALFLFYCFFTKKNGIPTHRIIFQKIKILLRNPIIITVGLFFLSLVVSTIFAVYPRHAFWGDAERMEGLFGMLHFGMLMVLTTLMFEKRDWMRFFKISLFVGIIIMFYGTLQYAGVSKFLFALKPEIRPISFVGNAAFLATHMFFLIMISAVLFYEERRTAIEVNPHTTDLRSWFSGVGAKTKTRKIWQWVAGIAAVWAVVTVFFTATRGAIIGLGVSALVLLVLVACGVGVEWAEGKLKSAIRKLALVIMGGIVLLGAIFFLTRSLSIWQSIPGLNRLAQTNVLDTKDPSTQTRLLTWQLSRQAFKERPLVGWGLENYIVAYEKYYNPDYAIYGETWLDRAHNKLFDLLVMQGLFGTFAYIALLVAVFWVAIKKRVPGALIIVAMLVGYVVQNLVLFDQVVSYATFFTLLAFLVGWGETMEGKTDAGGKGGLWVGVAKTATIIIAACLGYGAYTYSLVPMVQAVTFFKSPYQKNVEGAVRTLQIGMYPYNFAQANIRGQELDLVYLDQYFYNDKARTNPKFKPIGDALLTGIREIVQKDPYDIRAAVREAQMIDSLAREDTRYYPQIESLMRDTLKIAPNRQELFYYLAITAAKQNHFDEAIAIAEHAVSLSPNVPRAHFQLGLVFAGAGKRDEAKKEFNRLLELDPRLDKLLGSDHTSLLLIYSSWGDKEAIAQFVLRGARGQMHDIFNLTYQRQALNYFLQKRDVASFVDIARYIGRTNLEYKDDMNTFADLAEKGNWNILDTLP